MQEQIVSFNLTNNTNGTIPMSIMGNNTDVMDNSNATTQYYWNLTGFSVTIEDTITLQYKYVGQSNFSTISVPFSGTNLQNVADALNTLNIGAFFLTTSGGNTYLNNYTQYLVYGQLDITSSTVVVVGGSINTSFVVGTGFNNVVYQTPIQTDGKIVVGGLFTSYKGTSANYIVRLTSSGAIDTSFIYGTGFDNNVYSVDIQTDGKIVVGGLFTSYKGTSYNKIIRLNTDGSIDTSFIIGAGFNNYVTSIVIQTDGKIVVVGAFTSYDGTSANGIVRLTSSGAIDPTFVYGTGFNSVTQYIAIQTDGNILVGGIFTTYQGTSANGIVRLTTTGAIDPTFVYGTGFNNTIYSIYIQTDGNILIGGAFTSYKGTSANYIVRLTTTGAIDTSFIYGTGFDNAVFSIAIQNNGKILIGGAFTNYQSTAVNRIIRLNTDGSIDTSFIIGAGFDNVTYSISLNPTIMYVGGSFTTYQGLTYNRIISLYQ